MKTLYRWRSLLLIVCCIGVATCTSSKEENLVKVATVGDESIFLHNVFVDDVNASEVWKDDKKTQRVALFVYERARSKVYESAAEKNNISYSQQDIVNYKKELADVKWYRLTQKADADPETILNDIRERAKHLRTALELWKEDKQKGKDYFTKHFQHGELGGSIGDGYWNHYTSQVSDGSIMEELRKKEQITRDTFHLVVQNAKQQFLARALKETLFDAHISDRAVNTCWNVLHRTNLLELSMHMGSAQTLKRHLKKVQDGQTSFMNLGTVMKERLSADEIGLYKEEASFIKLLSINEVALSEGTVAFMHEISGNDRGRLIKIDTLDMTPNQKEGPSEVEKKYIRSELYGAYDARLRAWEKQQVQKMVDIHHPELKSSFEQVVN